MVLWKVKTGSGFWIKIGWRSGRGFLSFFAVLLMSLYIDVPINREIIVSREIGISLNFYFLKRILR